MVQPGRTPEGSSRVPKVRVRVREPPDPQTHQNHHTPTEPPDPPHTLTLVEPPLLAGQCPVSLWWGRFCCISTIFSEPNPETDGRMMVQSPLEPAATEADEELMEEFHPFFCCVAPGAGGQRPLPCGGPAEEQRSQAPPLWALGPEQRNPTENVEMFFFVLSEPVCAPDMVNDCGSSLRRFSLMIIISKVKRNVENVGPL